MRVEGFRINQIVDQIKGAKPDEAADVSKSLSHYDLDGARTHMVVTLTGKLKDEPKTWKFFVGKDSPDNSLVYVNSSDQDDKVFAISKKSLEGVFFKDARYLRSKRIFDFVETAVSVIDVKKGDKDLELKRGDNNTWTFLKPPLGFAGFDSEPPLEEKKFELKKELEKDKMTGVKGLLNAIMAVRVEDDNDFEPLGDPAAKYGLESDKAAMRIEIGSSADKKETTKEILLIGNKVQGRPGDFYYARLADDDGVMMISTRWLDPIFKALNDPGNLRSRDVAIFDPKDVDALIVKHGKDEVQFLKQEDTEFAEFKLPAGHGGRATWEMIAGSEKKKADGAALAGLIDAVLGKKAIVEFDDASEADLKKKDAEWGFDNPSAIVEVFLNAVEKEKKDEKKEEKKDEKNKKDEKKPALPSLKKDAKAVVKLELGKNDKEIVHVRRTLQDGTVSRFTMKKAFAELVSPPEGVELAYLERKAPSIDMDEVVSMTLERTTDKGRETLELERRNVEGGGPLWYVKDPLDPTGFKVADSKMATMVASEFARLPIKKWLKKLDDKEDLAKYGLKPAVITATITAKKTSPKALAGVIAALANPEYTLLAVASGAILQREADKGETVTIELGKESDQEKEKGGAFARHSGSKLFFLVDSNFVKAVKDIELRDRASMMFAQAQMEAAYKGAVAMDPLLGLRMFDSPYFTGQVLSLDADKIKDVKLSVRTRSELRSFQFERVGKDKDKVWTDKSGLVEFQLDPAKAKQLADDIAKLRATRFVAFTGGPRGEHKLGPKEYTVKLDVTTDDGRTVTLLVGTNYQNQGFFANSSALPEAVFFIPATFIEPLLRGADHFGKERSATE